MVVDVIEKGKGLKGDDRKKMMEKYMKKREKGKGIGIEIVRKIVEDNGGNIELNDEKEDFKEGRGEMISMVFKEDKKIK